MIQLLQEQGEVEILCFEGPKPGAVLPSNIKITIIPKKSRPSLGMIFNWLRPYVVNGYNKSVEHVLKQRLTESPKAKPILWISRLAMAQYIPFAKKQGLKVILDNHNAESILWFESALGSYKTWAEIPLVLQCAYYEKKFCKLADIAIAASDIDSAKLSRMLPQRKFHVLPNTVDTQSYSSIQSNGGNSLFFSGTLNYAPNIEALEWFTTEILPRVRASMGSEMPRVVVAGANPSAALLTLLQNHGIEVYMNPANMLPLLQEAAVFFVPLKNGSGTRLKILEAMAAGRAIVSTGKGAEGLVLTPSHDIFIADHEDAFTSAIVRLLRDSELQSRIGKNAIETISNRYDWRGLRPKLLEILGSLHKTESVK